MSTEGNETVTRAGSVLQTPVDELIPSNKHLAVGTPALGSGRWQAVVQAAVLRQVAVDVWLCWAAAVGRGMFCGKAAVAGG